ncbi:hypothetical protein AtubIFM57143_008931 [Aspergillus tubingensis]|nr:hypothetical protein AtubIFM57143_008931 [Aspergillus tubingensis]
MGRYDAADTNVDSSDLEWDGQLKGARLLLGGIGAGEIWGVKPMLLASLAIFTAFSGGCGGSRNLSEL